MPKRLIVLFNKRLLHSRKQDSLCQLCSYPELGTSPFEIAQSLYTLEQTLISGANEGYKKKSDNRTDKIKF